jgi:hypothetical protein
VKYWVSFLLGFLSLFSGCRMLDNNTYASSNRDFQKIQEYEKNYGSRIEIFLDLAETELLQNYKKKEFLMIRKDQPRAVVHPRKDVALRQLIDSAYEEGDLSKNEFDRYTKRCDELHSLWEKQWHSADKKARTLGYDR